MSEADSRVWYSAGLRFFCAQCGNCCGDHGDYAFVTLSQCERGKIPRFFSGTGRGELYSRSGSDARAGATERHFGS
ncbi:MAG: hypothetical protein ABI054_04315 [Planctomycetota bacterium]